MDDAVAKAVAKGPDHARAETLFAKVRGAERPDLSPVWKEFVAMPAAQDVVREHFTAPQESDRGRVAALFALCALDGACDGPKVADLCAQVALEGRSGTVRAGGRKALKHFRFPTPNRIVHALKATETLALRALDAIRENPDETGLFGLVVACDEEGHGGGGPRQYILSTTQTAYIQDITAVVQVQAVGYDPEIGYVQDGKVLDARVVKTEHYRRVFYEITGMRFPTTGHAAAWWAEHKEEVLKRIEERQRPAVPTP